MMSRFFRAISAIACISLAGCMTLTGEQRPSPQETTQAAQRDIIINHLNKGRPEAAIQILRPLLSKSPDDVNLQSLMGLAYMALSQPSTAREYLDRAHKLAPTPTTALNLSSALIEDNQPVKAYNLLLKTTRASNFSSYEYPERVHHNLGLAAEKQKKANMAEKHYRRALAKNPSFYLSLMQLSSLMTKQQKERAAQRYLEQARRLCLSCYDPVAQLSESYIRTGHYADATATLQAYLKRPDLDSTSKSKAQQLLQNASQSQQTAKRLEKTAIR